MPDPVKLSQKQTTGVLYGDDKFPLIRTPARESDPAKRNKLTSLADLGEDITPFIGGPNLRKGGPFHVRWYFTRYKADETDTSLEELPNVLLCIGCTCTVELGRQAGEYVLVYDPSPTALQVFRDGSFTTGIGGKWVAADSDEAAQAAIEFFDPAKDQGYYGPGDTEPQSVVRHPIGGVVTFQQARKRLTINGTTLIPAPTGAADDPNWQAIAAPTAPTPGTGSGTIALTGITEFRDRFADSFTGTLQQFAARLLVKEQFPGYASPSAGLASTINGYVERGTTIKPTLSPSFNVGDAGALTNYQLRRDNTQLAVDNTPPITYPAVADNYKIGEETVTYYAQFSYAQGPLKTSSQGNPAPGRIGAGTVQAQASVSGAPRLFYGPTASASDTSAKARLLPASRLTVEGSQFILNTGTTNITFEVVAPANMTVSVIDLDGFNAPLSFNPSPLQVQDAGATSYGYNVWRLVISTPYLDSHRYQVTLG